MNTPDDNHTHPEDDAGKAPKMNDELSHLIDIEALEGSKPAPDLPDPAPYELPDAFWQRSKARREIYAAAEKGGGKPTPALFVALAHVASFTPPEVRASGVATVSTDYDGAGGCSLNLMIAVVGKPGSGKGAVFRDAQKGLNVKESNLPTNYMAEANPVSGEGLARIFSPKFEAGGMSNPDNDVVETTVARRHAMIANPEGNEITKRMAREGSTFMEAILKAVYGESLSSQRADAIHNRHVPDGSYALGIALGIQPARAADLTQQTESGFTQRVICVPIEKRRSEYDDDVKEAAYDEYLRRQTETPQPSPWDWKPPSTNVHFHLERECHDRLHDLLNHKDCDTGDDADLHRPGMTMKLMCLLALLDNPGANGKITLTKEYLEDAETLLGVHSLGRSLIMSELLKRREQHAETQARVETQLEAKKEEINDKQVEADLNTVATKLKGMDEGQGISKAKLKSSTSMSRAASRFDAAVKRGVTDGLFHEKPSPNGRGIRVHLGEED